MKVDGVRVGYAAVPMRRLMRMAIHETAHTPDDLVEIRAGGVVGEGRRARFPPDRRRRSAA